MGKRYFFAQDDSCHWYLVPADRRAEWTELANLPEEDERAWDAPEWAERLNGGPGSYTFTDPIECE